MESTTSEREILGAVADYYSTRLRCFGPSPLGVDWMSEDAQRLRFDVLLGAIRSETAFSLIDYGCGYGALADHLVRLNRPPCEYIGYDIAEAMLEAARSTARPLVRCRFVGRGDPLPAADYCLASGVLNVSLGTDPDVWFQYMTRVWDHMHDVSRVAFAFNCLSARAGADPTGHLYRADPARVVAHCRRRYSPWVALLHDYPLTESPVVVRKAPP